MTEDEACWLRPSVCFSKPASGAPQSDSHLPDSSSSLKNQLGPLPSGKRFLPPP